MDKVDREFRDRQAAPPGLGMAGIENAYTAQQPGRPYTFVEQLERQYDRLIHDAAELRDVIQKVKRNPEIEELHFALRRYL